MRVRTLVAAGFLALAAAMAGAGTAAAADEGPHHVEGEASVWNGGYGGYFVNSGGLEGITIAGKGGSSSGINGEFEAGSGD
ncbi:hypothetical protein GCM10010129_74430 [Streptomyces fumigatiscleroticus]|nr:hypothetical protein GCM10010129_74430 [Streptomyces fumigatiscleroticus]